MTYHTPFYNFLSGVSFSSDDKQWDRHAAVLKMAFIVVSYKMKNSVITKAQFYLKPLNNFYSYAIYYEIKRFIHLTLEKLELISIMLEFSFQNFEICDSL